MTQNRLTLALATVLLGSIALVGCKKKEEPAPVTPPVATEPSPMPAPMPVAATASVTAVDLGTAVGPDKKITTAMSTFTPKDAIIAAVSTSTSDSAATVPAQLDAIWTYNGTTTIPDDPATSINLTGNEVTNFKVSKPDGWPLGKYKVEITLDGAIVQSRDFEVK
ncbi:hypothetical protein [Montanilutibacter psychrotolerans]|uniref:Lipoprotein n=1 Tax=Montanilutibacter psychrotolerans TaxID=1327343 RepID=A0A3M8SQX2_9GAMM|nr:hypothetical protein [Lysobacter psychrotolerans]RNF83721.1 hypothetical protein EER27_10120 [Lysobacter psychrotolerans]